jgi:hypothetical protein
MKLGERGGAVKYLYWSQRRINKILDDNGLRVRQTSTKITSPSIQGIAPTVEYTASSGVPLRSEIASLIENSLGQLVVSDFDTPVEIRYAKGIGTIVFGEFIDEVGSLEPSRRHALMFTSCDYGNVERDTVAICLFGSMENFVDYISSSGPVSERGWVASSAPAVMNFLQGRWTDAVDEPSREELAVEALKIADGQGMSGEGTDTWRAWRRGFTYGDIQEVAEWFAEIFLDVDLVSADLYREDGYRRILVGAPIWVRTPRLRAVRLYNEYEIGELEASARASVGTPTDANPSRIKKFINFLRR